MESLSLHELVVFVVYVSVAILLILGFSSFLYNNFACLARCNRIIRTIILVIICSVVVDLLSIVFILTVFSSSLFFGVRAYAILVAIPFLFAATAYWGNSESGEDEKRKFMVIQATGLMIGFISGCLFIRYLPGNVSRFLLEHTTIWAFVNYLSR